MRGRPPIIFGDGQQSRAFSYNEDVTPVVFNAGFSEKAAGEIVNIGSDEVVTVKDACRLVLDAMDTDVQPLFQPSRLGEVKHAYCTVEKSTQLLGYKTGHSLQGVEKTIEWAKSVGPQTLSYEIPPEITRKAPTVWLSKSM